MSLRVLIVVTHLLGAGHLTRAAALARAFAEKGHATTLASGGSPGRIAEPEGVAFVQLPPVRTVGTDFRTLLDQAGAPVDPAYLEERRDLLLRTLSSVEPDILITELFPFGRRVLAQEFTSLLHAARARRPRPLILCSIRDILASPSKPERIAEAHVRILRDYDAVLVHGDPDLIPLDASWPVDEQLRPFLRYTGYVDEHPGPVPDGARQGIVVSGGSSAASLPLYRAAIAAALEIGDRPWRILVGRGVNEQDFQTLRDRAPAHASIERARSDFRTLLAQADASVSQAGYNTVVDLLRSHVKPVLVPFEAGHETEQRLRAERLKGLGLAGVVPESELSPQRLADAIRQSLSQPPCPPVRVALDGARQSVATAEGLALARPALHPSIDWSPLDRALEHANGRSIDLWWRDDDAVADTPQLDRLLGLARRYEAGIALAVIPHRIEASLLARLAEEPRAVALVHGARHVNHAPAGEKKAEFGAHRPVDAMAAEAEQALRIAQEHLGPRLLPVFVPPWNRIAPGLVSRLPQAGFTGLSTFNDRKDPFPAEGLSQINTHIDPIDWRGTRSVVEPDLIVAKLAEAVENRLEDGRDHEPIGLLTHHLVHDEVIWALCERLMEHLATRNIRILSIEGLFHNGNRITVAP
ncbi:glycosyltransferase [Microvirga roseola]|uniref:glycosyltransferase n=1 Tax=Microvirga roseola TaxID=2883126 RepID=UPI001E5FF02E|nr:glycosyltransferase [Microvirga roseola]